MHHGHPAAHSTVARIAPIAVLFAVGACASSPTPDMGTGETRSVVAGVGSDAIAVTRNENIMAATLPGTPAELWPGLVKAFRDVGLPIDAGDARSRSLGSGPNRLSRIGDQHVSRFFQCPGSAYGNNAASADVWVVVQAQLVPVGESRTELRLQAEASSLVNGTRVRCSSSSRLATLLTEMLMAGGDAG